MAHRMCANADETCQLEDGTWYIQFIHEGQPGFNQSRSTFETLLDAKARASIFNHLDKRLTVADVQAIQMSSRFAGKVNP